MSKGSSLFLMGALAAIAAVGLGGCDAKSGSTSSAQSSQSTAPASSESTAAQATELVVSDEVVGTGPEAKRGDKVTVHYTGWLTDGTKFDSSLDRSRPFSFRLGANEVIAGWDQGVAGMKIGGKRKLTIPPDLGYGAAGAGGVIQKKAEKGARLEFLRVSSFFPALRLGSLPRAPDRR